MELFSWVSRDLFLARCQTHILFEMTGTFLIASSALLHKSLPAKSLCSSFWHYCIPLFEYIWENSIRHLLSHCPLFISTLALYNYISKGSCFPPPGHFLLRLKSYFCLWTKSFNRRAFFPSSLPSHLSGQSHYCTCPNWVCVNDLDVSWLLV